MAVESDDLGPVTVSTGAVTVEKHVTEDEFPVPTVVFDLRSTASEPVDVVLTDDVPESVDMGAIGFPPDYDGDGWTAFRDRRVQYETTLDPEASARTVYGVREDEAPDPETLLVDPRLDLPEGDETTDASDEADAVVNEEAEPVHDGLVTDGASAEGVPTADDEATDEVRSSAPEPAVLAASLAEAVREDAVADEDLATLRNAIGSEPEVPTSVEVRIDRLQGQVEDLAAYTDALEAFLDEEGEGRAAVAGFRAELDDLTAEVSALDDDVGSLDERMIDVEGGVDALAEDLGALADDLAALDEEVSAVAEDLDETRETVASVDDDLDRRLAELSSRVGAIDEDTSEMADEIERLDEFRERLNAAFGPGDES